MGYSLNNCLSTSESISSISATTIGIAKDEADYCCSNTNRIKITKSNKIVLNNLTYNISEAVWEKNNEEAFDITQFCFEIDISTKYIQKFDFIIINNNLYTVMSKKGQEIEAIDLTGKVMSFNFSPDTQIKLLFIPEIDTSNIDLFKMQLKLSFIDFYIENYTILKKDLSIADNKFTYLKYLLYKNFINERK